MLYTQWLPLTSLKNTNNNQVLLPTKGLWIMYIKLSHIKKRNVAFILLANFVPLLEIN